MLEQEVVDRIPIVDGVVKLIPIGLDIVLLVVVNVVVTEDVDPTVEGDIEILVLVSYLGVGVNSIAIFI